MQGRIFRVGACALASVLLLATISEAKRVKEWVPMEFPGVDEYGDLDAGLGSDGELRVAYNLKSKRFVAHGRSIVENLSGKRFSARKLSLDDLEEFVPDVTDYFEISSVKRGVYVVRKPRRGSELAVARFAAAGKGYLADY